MPQLADFFTLMTYAFIGFGIIIFVYILLMGGYEFIRIRLYRRGIESFWANKWNNAIRRFTLILEYPRLPKDKLFVFTLLARAFAYSAKGDMDKALADFTDAVVYSQKFKMQHQSQMVAFCRTYKGDFLTHMRRYDEALAEYHRVLTDDSKHVVASFGMIRIHYFKMDYQTSLDLADKTIQELDELTPTKQTIHKHFMPTQTDVSQVRQAIYGLKSANLIKLGQVDEAKAVLSLLKTEYPTSIITYSICGSIYFEMGDYSSALIDFETAMQLIPQDEYAKSKAGFSSASLENMIQAEYVITLFACGKIDEAQAQWCELQTQAPLFTSAERVGQEFFWTDEMLAKAKELEASLQSVD